MKETLITIIIAIMLTGCKSEYEEIESPETEAMEVKQDAAEEAQSISSIIEPEEATDPDKPEIQYLTPIAINAAYSVSDGVIYGDSLDDSGSTVFSNVDVSKSLNEWSIELEINHPYNSWLCIELDNDYFLTGYHRKGEWLWSDLIPECGYMMGLPYTYEEVLTMYGDIGVKQGNNFTLHLMRERSWSVGWFITPDVTQQSGLQ